MGNLSEYTSRDWHLNVRAGEGKRILALDGGGVRGLITLGILQRIEETLAPRFPGKAEDFRLAHYFDLIAGTSTGAIIATALALGMSVAQVKRLYDEMCPDIFGRTGESLWSMFGVARIANAAGMPGVVEEQYDAGKLEGLLRRFLGDRRLDTGDLHTGLMLCMKRIDTAAPWVVTNCPRAVYWDSPKKEWRPNRDYELWRLIRASSAAPMLFEPVEVVIAEKDHIYGEELGVFIDGAVAGLNNPSLQAYLTTTLDPYGFGWPSGRDHLFVVSVGTGSWRDRQPPKAFMQSMSWRKAMIAMLGMIQDSSFHTLMAMQAMSAPRKPWHLNGEVKGLDGHLCHGQELLTFQRYDAQLEYGDVERLLGARMTADDLAKLREIGSPDPEVLKRLYALGYSVGRTNRPGIDGIEAADFPGIFDPPGFEFDRRLAAE